MSALPEDTRPLRRLDRATALDRVVAFAQRFGLDHLRLAEHAAFPMLLTPDLLYRLWAAFTPEAPWTAVSDLLLSNLCREVDHELFEMEPTTRAVLLDMLQDEESLGPPRVGELAGFLLDYVEQQLGGDETGLRELSEAHRWMALAYTRPGDTAQSLAALLSQIFNKLTDGPAGFTGDDWSELLRVSSLVESLAVPLSDYRPLLSFARAMDRSAWGDTGAATRHLSLVLKELFQKQASASKFSGKPALGPIFETVPKAKRDEAAGIDLSLSFLRSIGGREFSERRVARALESVLRTARARSGTARQGEGPTPAPSRRTARPPAQPLCIGRDKQVEDLVETLLSPHPEPTPILGGLGMGKTTVSLSALYDPKVAECYMDRRYFVRCKVASSRPTLVQAIAKAIGVPLSGSDLEPRVLAELERAPAVLVLVGAETPWLDDRDDVEDFLAILSQISGLALVASFQGLTRPGKIHWGKTIFVDEPLELADAREVFLREVGKEKFRKDPKLEPLLEAVGRVPLAIVLIAKVAQSYTNLTAVLDRWEQHHLWLQDMDASLSLSIESLRRMTDRKGMTDKEKEAPLRLLQLLGVLPNGIAREELNAILPPDRGYAAETILLGAALAFENKNRLLLRAPLQRFVARAHPPGLDDLERLIKHFVTMADTYASWLGTWKGAEAVEKLGDEIANLEAVLLEGLGLPDPTPSIDAAVDVAAVILYSGLGTTKVLEEARDVAERRGDVLRQAHCIRRMGDIVQLRCDYPKAHEYYQMAFDIYRSKNKIVYMADCKQSMGDTELLRANYNGASDYFREAKKLYKEAKHKVGEAHSTKRLGDIERELGHCDAAERLYEEAFLLYRETNNVLGQANCIKGKGDNKLAQHDLEAARDLFERARTLYEAVGDILGKANCTKGLADIERELGNYADAERYYDEAFEDFGQLKNDLCQANCHKGKGDLAMDRGNFDEARQDYAKALQLYSQVNNVLARANCIKSLADLELKSSRFDKATSYYNRAMELYNKVNNIIMRAACIKGLGDALLGQSDTAEAIKKYQEALPLYQQEKDAFGEAFCQQSLGDAELALERPDCNRAKEYYESAVALFRKMNSLGELALCLLGLADVEGRLSAPQEVMQAHLSEALKQSEAMGDEWLRPRITSPQDRRDHLLAALVKWKEDGRTDLANALREYQSLTASAPKIRENTV